MQLLRQHRDLALEGVDEQAGRPHQDQVHRQGAPGEHVADARRHVGQDRGHALAGPFAGFRPLAHSSPDQQGGDQEGAGVDEQCPGRVEQEDEHAARAEPGELCHLRGGDTQTAGQDVAVAVEDLRQQHGPGDVEGDCERAGGERQAQDRRRRQPGYRQHPVQDGAGQVAGEHHGAARPAVGQHGQERAERPWKVGDSERRGGQCRGVAAAEHQEGQRHPGQVVAEVRLHLRREQPAELAGREHLAVGRLPLGCDSAVRAVGSARR
ncbi:hypothetical protein QMK19_38665 [Streptomyces sp. H10-C2]|uniref:hypothetical protein n=1 Tax=unclassified Streptomyces TaxID=2593676 RepID=UPI0024B936F1|nr:MULTISPECIES: hypothetical protein [unclassified Streptomyces]MDJ0346840.1 hypothetical protein [Streptomyces sp. PH10-H1]MDJ0375363.1 hypothetical protein [Streptomyces sp. H10-C2]